MEGRTEQVSKVSELLIEQGQLKYELKEMTALLSAKDAEIARLKAQLAKAQTKGPSLAELQELKA